MDCYSYYMYMCCMNDCIILSQDKEIGDIIDSCGKTVTVTVMPSVIYDHIVKW